MFKPSDNIGPYCVVRKLGQGGMGAVYEVVHRKLGVHYALKTFVLDHGHVQFLQNRFLAEGRILARLRHPNLVRVFDLDVDVDSGVPYFVMDLVQYKDGGTYTLSDVEPGSMDAEHLALWFAQLSSALDYIHAAGIIHRDIKFGNILLNAQGGVVLSDFGISRFSSRVLRRELNLERTMVYDGDKTGTLAMGTSGYMAPEVALGEEATSASDVYSLGVVFFRLLTGVRYENRPNIFCLLDQFDGSWQNILRRMLSENPTARPMPLLPEALKVVAAVKAAHAGSFRAVTLRRANLPPWAISAWRIFARVVSFLALYLWIFVKLLWAGIRFLVRIVGRRFGFELFSQSKRSHKGYFESIARGWQKFNAKLKQEIARGKGTFPWTKNVSATKAHRIAQEESSGK